MIWRGIEPVAFGVGVQFVEVGDAEREEGVGEELDRLGFRRVREEHGHVLADRAFAQQFGEDLGPPGALADDDARRMKIVVESLALAQELRREDQVGAAQFGPKASHVTDRHRGLDDHHRLWVEGHHVAHHGLDRAGVEIVGFGIVVGRRGDHHVVHPSVRIVLDQRRPQVQRPISQVILDLEIVDPGFAALQHRHLFRNDVQRHHFMVLRQ
jgi:hypothetical protein